MFGVLSTFIMFQLLVVSLFAAGWNPSTEQRTILAAILAMGWYSIIQYFRRQSARTAEVEWMELKVKRVSTELNAELHNVNALCRFRTTCAIAEQCDPFNKECLLTSR